MPRLLLRCLLLCCLALMDKSTEPDRAVLVTVDTLLAQRNPRRRSREDRGQDFRCSPGEIEHARGAAVVIL